MHNKETLIEKSYIFGKYIIESGKLAKDIGAIFGKLMHQKREEYGLSFKKLSEATGISPAVLAETENGNKIPRIESMLRIAYELNIPFETILAKNLLPCGVFSATEDGYNTNLTNTLFTTGLSKEDITEILNYIKYKIDTKKK